MYSLETLKIYVFILITHEPVMGWKGLKREILTRENFKETNRLQNKLNCICYLYEAVLIKPKDAIKGVDISLLAQSQKSYQKIILSHSIFLMSAQLLIESPRNVSAQGKRKQFGLFGVEHHFSSHHHSLPFEVYLKDEIQWFDSHQWHLMIHTLMIHLKLRFQSISWN